MRIAAYCRVSTDTEKQLDSLRHQKEFFSEYADRYGYELIGIYADEGISGKSLKKRTEFLRLMEDAKRGEFDMVVTKDVSRFARNTLDFLQSIRTLKSFGVDTVFVDTNMKVLGDSEFCLTVLGAAAQAEITSLSQRIKFGKKITGKKGRTPSVIYGYTHIDNYTLSIDQKEAETVKRIFALYSDLGYGCKKISLELNRLGIPTKNGYIWDAKGVRRILTNSIYCGDYVNCKYEVEDCLTGRQKMKPGHMHLHHNRPEWTIVSREEFERAQELLSRRREQYKGKNTAGTRNSTKHLFSSLIICDTCGGAFARKSYKRADGSERVYWKCSTNDRGASVTCANKVRIEEKTLIEAVGKYFASVVKDRTEFANKVVDVVEDKSGNCESKTDFWDAERQKSRLEFKQARYREMCAEGVMTVAELKNKLIELEKELYNLNLLLNNCKKNN